MLAVWFDRNGWLMVQSAPLAGGKGPGLACSWVWEVLGILDGDVVDMPGFRFLALASLVRFFLLEPGREDDNRLTLMKFFFFLP